MNNIQKRRLYLFIWCALGVILAAAMILYALRQNINVFLTPSQVHVSQLKTNYHFRLGGVVKPRSVYHDKNNLDIHFIVTDFKNEILVRYNGILPDLFHDGKGVIAEGYVDEHGIFIASSVLAKHDETYSPIKVSKLSAEKTK